ncbi:GNAT family N-acetyltransferase [Sphingobacterium spiritivorum]|uniref:GNAT family N-acetyltransferase n=1 Tax=Sphingobacterium spiritivorum TaxID=258 RepID=UPI003DA695D4
MEDIIIKKVGHSDLKTLQEIGRTTFAETFSEGNTTENMDQYLDEGFSLNKLEAEIENPDSEFFFAIAEDKVVGYLKVNYSSAQTELQDESALEIERIYVLKALHGKKVGQLLYEKAIELAHKSQAGYVWLGVWEENPRAISFYKKNGFVEFDKHIFKLGDDEQIDIMMKKQL